MSSEKKLPPSLIDEKVLFIRDFIEQTENNKLCNDEDNGKNFTRISPNIKVLETTLELAKTLWKKGKHNESLKMIEGIDCLSLRVNEENLTEFYKIRGEIKKLKGNIYVEKAEFSKASECFYQALDIYQSLNDEQAISSLLNNLGVLNQQQGKLDVAQTFYENSLKIKQKLGDPAQIASTLNNLGILNKTRGTYNEALKNYNRCKTIYTDLEDLDKLAIILLNIGDVFIEKGELSIALEYHEESLFILNKLDNEILLSASLHSMGDLHVKLGNYKTAEEYYTKCLQLRRKVKNEIYIARTLYELLKVYIGLGNHESSDNCYESLCDLSNEKELEIVEQYTKMATAIRLKNSKRLADKTKAYSSFQEIIDAKTISNSLKIEAMLNLAELTLFEIQATNNIELLSDIDVLSEKLLHIAKTQQSYDLLVKSYFIKSKFALLDKNIELAKQYLSQALINAEEKGLKRLALQISDEMDLLKAKLSIWQSYFEQDLNISKITEEVGLEGLFMQLLSNNTINTSAIVPEKPVMLSIFSNDGLSIYSSNFQPGHMDEQLIAGFLSAVNSFMNETFQFSGSIEKIKHENFTLLLKKKGNLLFSYVFEGQASSALLKLDKLVDTLSQETRMKNLFEETTIFSLCEGQKTALTYCVQEIFA